MRDSTNPIGQTVSVSCWMDGRIQPVRVEFTRLDHDRVRLQAVSARPLGDAQMSYGRRYCAVLGEPEWRTRPGACVGDSEWIGPDHRAYDFDLAAWALGKLNIHSAETP